MPFWEPSMGIKTKYLLGKQRRKWEGGGDSSGYLWINLRSFRLAM
jgi:hypothetical protein